jgi:xanthosine utilization system XapX-like protein
MRQASLLRSLTPPLLALFGIGLIWVAYKVGFLAWIVSLIFGPLNAQYDGSISN